MDLPNPGMEFIDPESSELAGSALTFTIEGNRPLLVEIEALTTYTKFGYPKRSARGISQGKLELLIAVMSKFTTIKLESSDVYLNIAHGLTLSEPGVDLACIAAIISSKKESPL
jgi:DNA repair protein RadA/Sms